VGQNPTLDVNQRVGGTRRKLRYDVALGYVQAQEMIAHDK